jgi:LysM repeat protein
MLRRLMKKPGVFWIIPLSLVIFLALACNLPERQAGGLGFSTDQPHATQMPALFPTDKPGLQPNISNPPAEGITIPGQAGSPFFGLQTATPGAGVPRDWITPKPGVSLPPFEYNIQPGDTAISLAGRFGVTPDQINPTQPLDTLLVPGQQLTIPNILGELAYPSAVLPDSVVIYSPLAKDFVVNDYVTQAGGFLSTYQEEVEPGEWQSGAEIVERVAREDSTNPQLLLAFLQFRSGWVLGQPRDPSQLDYPIGFYVPEYHGLYKELSLTAKQLNIGYYGWRAGTFTELSFPDSTRMRLHPGLNAGSVAIENLLSKFYLKRQDWLTAMDTTQGLPAVYKAMFKDPWQAAAAVEPLLPAELRQPTLELPFTPGEPWSLTSGPHIAWTTGTPRGALDFAPITGEPPCVVSSAWVTASAPGLVVRSERGVVTLDLDGDGFEQTGWVLVYMHIAAQDRVDAGSWVDTNLPLGHPSCEGGQATGTHFHLARRYNGEWLPAGGPLPFVLDGWVAASGSEPYQGTLTRGSRTVAASTTTSASNRILYVLPDGATPTPSTTP